MTFNFPSFLAAATNAAIEVAPVFESWVTFAQFTFVVALAIEAGPASAINDVLASVALATNVKPNLLFFTTRTVLH